MTRARPRRGDPDDLPEPGLRRTVVRIVKAVLTARRRKRLKAKQFALGGRRYPINDPAHARNALSRVSQYGTPEEKARVRAAVGRKYPKIGKRRRMAKSATLPASAAGYRITAAQVLSLALCRRGKNGLRTLLKSDGEMEIQALVKADAVATSGELLFVAYAPERPDADRWVADQAVVKAMSRDLARNGFALDVEHDGEVLDPEDAFVAESFIVQKADPRFEGWKNYDGSPAGDLTGAWAGVIQIDDPELRAACEAGDIDGVSVFGRAAVEPLTKSSAADEPMTPEQIKELSKSLATAVVEAMKPKAEEKTAEQIKAEAEKAKVETPPVFAGDPTKREDLETFQKSLKVYELSKSVASGEMTSEKVAALLAGLDAGPTDEEIGAREGDSPEVLELRRQLFKSQRRSNAPAGGNHRETADAELRKAELAEGKAIAALHNEHVGGAFRLVPKS